MKLNFVLRFALVVLLVCAGSKIAAACSCGASGNVLESFERAGNVVALKAVAVETAGKDDPAKPVDNVKSTRMVVEKVYKGKLKVGDEINFAQGGGADCIWTFKEESVGRRYLFYLGAGDRTNPYWIGSACSRSGAVEGATDDLLYLEKLDKVRGKTRISGTINFEGYRELTEEPPVEGRKLRIVGGGRSFDLKTDKNGVYEIYDLPPGRYEIIPGLPKGWKVNQFYLDYTDVIKSRRDDDDDEDDKPLKRFFVNLQPQRHAAVDFHLEIDNAIRGKVLAPDGTPMRRVCLNLYPSTGIDKNATYLADCVEKDEDTFEIDEVPPGRYILVVNDDGEVTAAEPFGVLYYPGVSELEKAAVINVGVGEFLENINVIVPKIEELVSVRGVLRYADGKPVVDELVRFDRLENKSEYTADAQATTDAQGRFSLKILKGMKGRLYGSMYIYSGEYEKCPVLEALIRESGKSSYDALTPAVEIGADGDVFDVELKFPFPACKKAKD